MAGEKAKSKANAVAIAVIVAIVAAGLAAWSAFQAGSASDASSLTAIVHDGDGGELELPLGEDTTRVVTTSLGSNTIVVAYGSVHVEEADCANHDCIKQGAIDTPGQQIVCLPHKLWIEVVSAGDAAGTDESAGNDVFDAESR